ARTPVRTSMVARSVGTRPEYAHTYDAAPGTNSASYGERSDTTTVGLVAASAVASARWSSFTPVSATPTTTTSAFFASATALAMNASVAALNRRATTFARAAASSVA